MLAPMQYRNFVWPNNPRVFEVKYRRTLHSYKLPFSGVSRDASTNFCSSVW